MQEILIISQLFFTIIVGIYFMTQLKGQQSNKSNIGKEVNRQFNEINSQRSIKLTKPLTELVRPKKEEDIVGQADAMKSLKVALCGHNPQHILIYGMPGVGKTAAARIALELAKNSPGTPFSKKAPFVEIDATTLRFDERNIADPLIGSVHDPIYQGAGAFGSAGIPRPKPGAVTKANGGVLFIDEIGELNQVQMNKLLKVLEDRKVMLESSYYSRDDDNIPHGIHDIFQNGLPADFRLIGATTRSPEDIPPALRSRCVEIFFNDLSADDIAQIVNNVVSDMTISIDDDAKDLLRQYQLNGRDAVNIVQTAYSLANFETRATVTKKDMEWVLKQGKYPLRAEPIISLEDKVGYINGLAVTGSNKGVVFPIEAACKKVGKANAKIKVSGIIEEEEFHSNSRVTKRKSMATNSVENILTVLKIRYNIDVEEYLLHINYSSGMPVDGPSAGTAMFTLLYSAITNQLIPGKIAMTGEISVSGKVCPVGGVYEKLKAAKEAGITKAYIPKANMQEMLNEIGIEIIPVEDIAEIVEGVFNEKDILLKASELINA